jgi:hypothetical protein
LEFLPFGISGCVPDRHERCAENQYLFNNANSRLHDLVEKSAQPDQRIPFLCECADDSCLATVELELTEYEDLHQNADVFVIVPGHARVDREVVLHREDRFEQVEKRDA